MTKKEFKEAKYNLDDIKFVVEWFEENTGNISAGSTDDYYKARLRARTLFYSLQDQVTNKLQNTKGVLKDEGTTTKENC